MKNFKNKIIYEVYLKSFFDTSGNGQGDIKGLIDKLDYLKDLGITTIWITPFYQSPMVDEGYDISNYYKVNKNFGSMSDIDLLLKKCQEKNLEVMLDFVLNHTSSKHEWFQKALKGDKEYQDYYFFFDEPQNEWEGRFGGGVWEYVPSIKKYYLHLYNKNQPDLNWDNEKVRKKMYQTVYFWLSKNISSCKFDVLYLISKPTPNWEPKGKVPSALACRDGKNVHKYIKELVQKIKQNFPNTYLVGEMSFSTIEECINYSHSENNEMDIVMTGRIAHNLPKNASDGITIQEIGDNKIYIDTLKHWYSHMDKYNGWICSFTENHDSPRTINRFGDINYRDASAKAHILNVAFLRGTPFFLQGQEIGMINPDYDNLEDYVDIKSINAIKENKKLSSQKLLELINRNGRDSGRNTMAWSLSKNGGFSESINPWRKTNMKNIEKYNVEDQRQISGSILSFFKEVVSIRKKYDVLNYGDINFLKTDEYILAYTRKYQEKIFLVVINMSSEFKEMDLSHEIFNVLISNYDADSRVKRTIKPWEAFLAEVKN